MIEAVAHRARGVLGALRPVHRLQPQMPERDIGEVVGTDRVDADMPPVMGGEDFSYMLEARPGAFIFVGNGDTAGLHHPRYNFNDAAIPYGSAVFAKLIERSLPRE